MCLEEISNQVYAVGSNAGLRGGGRRVGGFECGERSPKQFGSSKFQPGGIWRSVSESDVRLEGVELVQLKVPAVMRRFTSKELASMRD
jgi:hypothetical protein